MWFQHPKIKLQKMKKKEEKQTVKQTPLVAQPKTNQ